MYGWSDASLNLSDEKPGGNHFLYIFKTSIYYIADYQKMQGAGLLLKPGAFILYHSYLFAI